MNAHNCQLDRRTMLSSMICSLSALLLQSGQAWSADGQDQGERFSRDTVIAEAKALSEAAFKTPGRTSDALKDLSYSTYRQIRYRKDEAVWGRTPTAFSIELFSPGYIYREGVDVFVVESGRSHELKITSESFETPTPEVAQLLTEFAKFAGFRLHYPFTAEGDPNEFIVFQGASYFRAVSVGQNYGLSARGLAIDVGEPTGEEFPIFRRFWIERPSAHVDSIVVHALLDSKRVTGAYRFGIYPGAPTVVDIDATLFARETLTHIGLGALTSMYLHGSVDATDRPDYRPAVHDSLGLAMHTGRGERLWRPLSNPKSLQISVFTDNTPKGFGLIQRDRRFASFQDLEAVYEKRPSAWVAPRGDWGAGQVQLVEIPTPHEGNDNIVAYWRPKQPLQAGQPHAFSYRLTWPNDAPVPRDFARSVHSATGLTLDGRFPQVMVDYARPAGTIDMQDLDFNVSVSKGKIVGTSFQHNPRTGGARIFVTFDPENAPFSEIRIQPHKNGVPIGETWLYRWLED